MNMKPTSKKRIRKQYLRSKFDKILTLKISKNNDVTFEGGKKLLKSDMRIETINNYRNVWFLTRVPTLQ